MNELDKSGANHGLAREIWLFLRASRKWWLLPIIVVFALFATLIALSTTAVAPFIYTLF